MAQRLPLRPARPSQQDLPPRHLVNVGPSLSESLHQQSPNSLSPGTQGSGMRRPTVSFAPLQHRDFLAIMPPPMRRRVRTRRNKEVPPAMVPVPEVSDIPDRGPQFPPEDWNNEIQRVELDRRRQPIAPSPSPLNFAAAFALPGLPAHAEDTEEEEDEEDEEEDELFLAPQQYNILLVGDAEVGQTSLILSLLQSRWTDAGKKWSVTRFATQFKNKESYLKIVNVDGHVVKLNIWEAKVKNSAAVLEANPGGWDAVVLCADASRPGTLSTLQEWWTAHAHRLRPAAKAPVTVQVTGLKSDLLDPARRWLSRDYGEYVARSIEGAGYAEVSAKTGSGVEALFASLVGAVYTNRREEWEALAKEEAKKRRAARTLRCRAQTYFKLCGEWPDMELLK